MIDKALKETLVAKIGEGEFGAGDVLEYLKLFCQVCDSSEDIQDEVGNWNRNVQFRLDGGEDFWWKVHEGKFECGPGSIDAPGLTLKMPAAAAAAILIGEKDATSAYMDGTLKVEGQLPDAVKVRTLIEIVRDELDL